MQPKRSKYDTNPLDETVADRADDSFTRDTGSELDPGTQDMSGVATREIGRTSNESARNDPEAETATRRIDDSYPSVFVQRQSRQQTYEPPRPTPANIYQPPPVPPPQIYQRPPPPQVLQQPGRNIVAGIGIPERWAVMIPYLPFWLGIVACVLELLLVPRNESKVRFHAAQGLLLQVSITVISMLLAIVGDFSGRMTGAGLFRFASFVFLIIAMIRVFKGKSFVITPLDEPRQWLEEKIKPRK